MLKIINRIRRYVVVILFAQVVLIGSSGNHNSWGGANVKELIDDKIENKSLP